MRGSICIVAASLAVGLVATAVGQSVSTLQASWLKNPKGNLFFQLNGDGSKLFVNRSSSIGREELVELPTAGGAETVWHTNPGRSIFNRFAVSDDGRVLVFATNGGRIYGLTKPGATPKVVADVSPDGDPRQLQLSRGGTWVAFTASNFKQGGGLGSVKVNLYVAATDGSTLYRVTPSALPDKFIPFDLSADGKTLVWVDDRQQGPLIAGIDGKNPQRLPLNNARVQCVFCNSTGSLVYYQTLNGEGVRLFSVKKDGTGLKQLHHAPHGDYEVARESSSIRLRQFDPQFAEPGQSWQVNGAMLTKMFTRGSPGYVASWAWSGDGRVLVWRDLRSPEGDRTFVWRAGS